MTDLYKPRPERWPQFSLKTFIVLVTALGVFLGWLGAQLKWIRDRHEALLLHKGLENRTIEYRYSSPPQYTVHYKSPWFVYGESAKAPWSIRILGEQGIKTLLLYVDGAPDRDPEHVQSEKGRLAKLFPEAEMIVHGPSIQQIHVPTTGTIRPKIQNPKSND